MLAQLVAASGAQGEIFKIVPDLEEAHLESFRQAASYDALVVAGGVSVGAKDLVKPTLQRLGAKLELWRVAVKPGKPFMFGRLGKTLVFGLPGNPVSAFVTFLLFVRPALWKLGGRSELELPRVRALLEQDLVNRGDRPHYFRGIYEKGTFQPVGRQESHALFALSRANALCRLEPDADPPCGFIGRGDPDLVRIRRSVATVDGSRNRCCKSIPHRGRKDHKESTDLTEYFDLSW